MLDREEYIEQAYFFRALAERSNQSIATQDLLMSIREEVLATTKLPLAIDFLAAELRLHGVFATAMRRMLHYFTSFQVYVVEAAEDERGRFDLSVGLDILRREAEYRAAGSTQQGMFFFQFECLCRNRLGYDHGLAAMADDPLYDDHWRQWIGSIRRQIGMVELTDLLYVRSAHSIDRNPTEVVDATKPVLFGAKEGRIALAHRRKDPLLFFAAIQRHLGYPSVPRPKRADESRELLPLLLRRVERLESRLKLLEEEQRGGIDLSRFSATGRMPADANEDVPIPPFDAAPPE
jgi:hypothetical protein